MFEATVNELQQEGATTRRVLERIPADKLAWSPHAKSMTLGQLALHIATTPAGISGLAKQDGFDVANANFTAPQPASLEEILAAHDASIAAASAYIGALTPDEAAADWRFTAGERVLMAMPRAGLLRTLMLNHWYHHRGQLSVYLRLLDVPVPVIYGRSADENPFA